MMTVLGRPTEVLAHVVPPSVDQKTPTSEAMYRVDGDVRESTAILLTGAFGKFPEILVQCAP
jgi:hypothetical protein